MHPIERLRYVARSEGGLDQAELLREAAGALGAFGSDTRGLVMACKRLVERNPAVGPLWALCARVLCGDARVEAWRTVEEAEHDPTQRYLADALPDGATVTVIGWPEVAAFALPRRGDLEVLVVDTRGDGRALVRRLQACDVDAVLVPESGIGAAVLASALVCLEAQVASAVAFAAAAGSRAAAATAQHAGIPVWLVVGALRALPPPLWDTLAGCLVSDEPWEDAAEIVPLELVDLVFGPGGALPISEARLRQDCPCAPELLSLAPDVTA